MLGWKELPQSFLQHGCYYDVAKKLAPTCSSAGQATKIELPTKQSADVY